MGRAEGNFDVALARVSDARASETSYLVTLLGADAAKDIAAFLRDPLVANRFDKLSWLRADGARFVSERRSP